MILFDNDDDNLEFDWCVSNKGEKQKQQNI